MTKINKSNSIMLLATRFDNLGGWTVEQQFVLQMGTYIKKRIQDKV